MPSDRPAQTDDPITGRCYCGARAFRASTLPKVVTYCHCCDCRRVSGAPVAAFAAFEPAKVQFAPPLGSGISVNPGVTRWFCERCGSPVAARYDYLPDMIYISLGLIDQADSLPPEMHAHSHNTLCWLNIKDDLPRESASSRDRLNAAHRR